MDTNNSTLDRLFGQTEENSENLTLTENGDIAYKKLNNNLLDILFKTEYLRHHTDEIVIGSSEKEQLFSMFIRDPRCGVGQRVVGRELMKQSGNSITDILQCGRADDLWKMYGPNSDKFKEVCEFIRTQILTKSDLCELVKKWCPRFPTHNKTKDENGNKVKQPLTDAQRARAILARAIATEWGMNKQQYGKFIKAETVETMLSAHREDDIVFSHVPSLAAIKYANTFTRNSKTAERYASYLNDVREGNDKINMSVTTVYDIYKNLYKDGFDADLWFEKLPKISGSFLPIIDVSGSMYNQYDAIGKALSVGLYLSVCSTFCNNQFVTFSNEPSLVSINIENGLKNCFELIKEADWGGSTNLGAVMQLIENLDEQPEYLVVMTDMQFNCGTRESKLHLQNLWKEKGYTTKIVWWNFATSNACAPETDEMGNIFMSGYSPMLLQFLETGFDGEQFLEKLLSVYAAAIGREYPTD